jgi:hypothetical protein
LVTDPPAIAGEKYVEKAFLVRRCNFELHGLETVRTDRE